MRTYTLILALLLAGGLVGHAATIFDNNTSWKYLKGTAEASTPIDAWRAADFDDSGWLSGNAPFYYENSSGFSGNTELTDMFGGYTCIFMRKTFTISNPADLLDLTLDVQSDDGCIIWLNGTEVKRINMPAGILLFDETSLGAAGEPNTDNFMIPNPQTILVEGQNVVAIQAFNSSIGSSSDFIVAANLSSSVDDVPPVLIQSIPSGGSTLREMTTVDITFDDAVVGVDAGDLLINGTAADSMQFISDRQYVFSFVQPPNGLVTIEILDGDITDGAGNPFVGSSWTVTIDPDAAEATVIISEFLTDNENGIEDENANTSDWIEIKNLGPVDVDLAGWYLTDDAADLAKWRFPSRVLSAGQFLIVFASGKDRAPVIGELHTSFGLNNSGEYLGLINSSGEIVSEFAPAYPPQPQEDVSYGRDVVNPELTGYFATPTPGAQNSTSGAGFAPTPVFSLKGGVYPSSVSVSLSAPSGTIRYTLDGTAPTPSSPPYFSALNIANSTVVHARVFENDLLPSEIVVNAYNIMGPGAVGFKSKLPVVVFNTSGRGIAANVAPGLPRTKMHVTMIPTFRGIASLDGEAEHQSMGDMEIRGQTSSGFPKKPYGFELQDAFGNDKAASFFGLPSESDWVLRNPYSDKTLINDFMTFEIHEEMGHYAVRRRLIEVFVDTNGGRLDYPGDYHGVYCLLEKIKIDKNRVDVKQLGPSDDAEPEITGGYIWKKDKNSTGDLNFSTSGGAGFGGQGLKYHDPKPREITPAQQNWLRNHLNSFEQSMYAADWLSRADHYTNYINVGSWVDSHWIVEFPKQIDGYRISNYMSKERGGKINYSPIWDWNLAWGNANYLDGGNADGWYYSQLDQGAHIWLRRLINGTTSGSGTTGDPDFKQAIIDRWGTLRTNILHKDKLVARAEELHDLLAEAAVRDEAKWPRWGNYIWPNPNGGASWDVDFQNAQSYRQLIDEKIKWIRLRYDWVDGRGGGSVTAAPQQPDFTLAGGNVPAGSQLGMASSTGTIYYTMDGTDPRLPGGAINPASQVYGGGVTINDNANVIARVRLGNEWSAPTAAIYVPNTPPLRITELMYHPLPPASMVDTNDQDNFEYIELKNTSDSSINLAGYSFSRGLTYAFTSGSLAAGEIAVLVKDPAAFQDRYGVVANVYGPYEGNLDNGGERITLLGPVGEISEDFEYKDGWYPLTDGLGFSLVLRDITGARALSNFKESWRAGNVLDGTPGEDEGAVPNIPGILVNEALTHTDLPQVDAIELYNPTGDAVDIGGWFLSDSIRTPKFEIPAGTTIPAGGYLVFDETDFNTTPGVDPSFALSALGDDVYLFSADGAGNLTGYVHGHDFGGALNGVTFGRYITSTGDERFVAQASSTLGAANSGPASSAVVITEVMYHPADIFLNGQFWDNQEHEFIEIHNRSASPVALEDAEHEEETWRLRDAVKYTFPENTTLQPDEFILVVSFDPEDTAAAADFRSTYGVPPTLRLFGPYSGKLDNSSDSVELVRPESVIVLDGPVEFADVLVDKVNYKDSFPWPLSPDGIGSSLQRVDSAAYGNDPANWVGAAPSVAAEYVPGEGPVITTQPQSQVVVSTTTLTLSVEATGSNLSYQWRLNGANLPDATSSTLVVPNISPAQAGDYRVVVLNNAGDVTSAAATVEVVVAAEIISQPQSASVVPGETVTFSVAATSTTAISYQWRRNGIPINGATGPSLTLSNVQSSDDGVYDVTLTDSVGTIYSQGARLAVLIRADIVVHPVGRTNVAGSTIILSVQVRDDATLPVGFRWRVGGQTLDNQVLFSRTSFFRIDDFQLVNAGSYSVVVTNAAYYTPGILSRRASVRLSTDVFVDTDMDGLSDEYEEANGLNPNQDDASEDLDGDGFSNEEEEAAGTDPNDASSFLKIDSVADSGGISIQFNAVDSKTYMIQYSDSPGTGTWNDLTGVPAISLDSSSSRAIQVVDPDVFPGQQRYYRIVTPAAPAP